MCSMKNKYLNICYRRYNCFKFPNSVGIGPFNWFVSRSLFNKLNIYHENRAIYSMKNKYLNIFTDIVIVLNFQILLILSLEIGSH